MDIEYYGLRIFCRVFRDGAFSSAARALRLSQPTVSQQIAKLESILGEKLFARVGHEIFPTPTGHRLYEFAQPALERLVEFTDDVAKERAAPEGLVRYAMPESCQWTPHYKRIMAQIATMPGMRFEIAIAPNDTIVKGLLEGALDFGFIVGEKLHPELRFEKYADESYSAIAATNALFAPLRHGDLSGLRLVTYPGWESFFMTWAKSHGFGEKTQRALRHPSVGVGTLAGAIHAIEEGAGVGILPAHCVAESLKTGALKEWKSANAKSSSQPIYLTRKGGSPVPRRVEVIIDLLRKAKQGSKLTSGKPKR